MATPFDVHTWYRLTNDYLGPRIALDVVEDGLGNPQGVLKMAPVGEYPGQYWQFVPQSSGTFKLHSKFFGHQMALDVWGNNKIMPHLARAGHFSGQYWKILEWGDGTWKLSNGYSGSNFFLDTYSDTHDPFMAEGNHTGQHWTITPIANIAGGNCFQDGGANRRRNETDTHYRRVKIAVIDTGLDPEHGLANKINYKDFVEEGSTERKDCTGHGTISVDLILRVYEAADLYVARVFERDEADERKEPYLTAKAIRWAVNQKVDIISISAGFRTSPRDLREAVNEASAANILIFAAASNWGNLDEVAYPARMKDHVFCIFSTNGTLKNSSRYNPEPRSNADNFAILGEGIELYPGREPVQGTSMATAIAAGLAGRILDFARHTDCRDNIEGGDIIHTKAGMTAIFKAISRSSANYDCIAPWRLLKMQWQGDRENREKDREDVRKRISDAIEMAN
ncbi:Extracellular alkaline serine protease [Penicillium macrosclerotiorum]|uniref:Extracellular alkaline serine protease n=1 Tax=Penicillium macrosclerotiorum TaxID=303699 RepID=UPI00254793CA|nr:Extracellular alkaline serine protease [Penicillium macrosclerotiorum]KAJ5668904.1 Extracellular alkaline serine protease [Penicillium macrosclerotiorum]